MRHILKIENLRHNWKNAINLEKSGHLKICSTLGKCATFEIMHLI